MPPELKKRTASWVTEALIWICGSALLFVGLWMLTHGNYEWGNLDATQLKTGVVLTPSGIHTESIQSSQSSPKRHLNK